MTTCSRDQRRRRARWAAAFAGLCVFGAALVARAQSSEDQAAARVLFEDGRQLMKSNQYAAACPKLEAARKLYTSAGILLNLADCHEKIGRTASAWTEFGEAATVATRSNRPDDADEARRRKAALEPSLARIVIRVPHPAPGLVVKRDGAVLADAAWGAALPVDPGAHAVSVEAPGFEPWTTSVKISSSGQTETVDVPELHATAASSGAGAGAGAAAVVSKSEPSTATSGSSSSRTLAWVLVGGGAAVAVGGGVLMLVESGKASTARENNDTPAYNATQTPWKVGLVGAIVGAAAAATGAVLLATGSNDAPSSSVQASAWIEGGAGGFVVAGRW